MMNLFMIDLIGKNNLDLESPGYSFVYEFCHFPFPLLPWAVISSANILQIAVFFRLLERMSLGSHTELYSAPSNSCLPEISKCADFIWK